MDPGTSDRRQVKSLNRACEIIELLRELDGGRVTELADHLDMSAGSVHTYLTTLQANGFVEKEGQIHRLSSHLIVLGEHVRNSSPLYSAAVSEVDKLVEESEECSHLMTEHRGLEVSLYQTFGRKTPSQEYHIQNRGNPRRYLHYSASGKAMLANFDREKINRIIETHGLIRQTEATITEKDELLDELAQIRERGFALNDEEQVKGFRAVGAPIQDDDGRVLGAISLSAPTRRFKGETFRWDLPEVVMNATDIVEVNIETNK